MSNQTYKQYIKNLYNKINFDEYEEYITTTYIETGGYMDLFEPEYNIDGIGDEYIFITSLYTIILTDTLEDYEKDILLMKMLLTINSIISDGYIRDICTICTNYEVLKPQSYTTLNI